MAYRITGNSLSDNRLQMFDSWVDVFRHLEERYQTQAKPELVGAFRAAYASKRRAYAKILMGAGEIALARQQIWHSVQRSPPTRLRGEIIRPVISYLYARRIATEVALKIQGVERV